MTHSIHGRGIGRLIVLIGLLFGTARASLAHPDPGRSEAAPSLTGVLSIIWGDALDGTSTVNYYLTTDEGHRRELMLLPDAAPGGIWRLNGRRVTVRPTGGRARETPLTGPLLVARIDPVDRAADRDPLVGELPYLSLLCAFPDGDGKFNPIPFYRDMYGNDAPQLGHYWDELSYGAISMAGSAAAGPFPMPHPYAVYGIPDNVDLDRLFMDCVAAADPTVDFSAFYGVNLMFNVTAEVLGVAWGGGLIGVEDGDEHSVHVTWLPTWAWQDVSVVAHEMGHTFSLPHSSGPYGYTYDNPYDVMSADRYPCYVHNQYDDTYGCVGQQTIGHHKQMLGWLAGDDIHTNVAGSETVEIDILSMADNGRPRLIIVPVQDVPGLFYTVEARDTAGYDSGVPGAGVVIHRVDLMDYSSAILMDGDGNGDTTDDGVYWKVDETFAAADDGIAITVTAATATGYEVHVRVTPPPPFTTCTAQAYLSVEECEALVALYQQTKGPQWTERAGWLAWKNPCNWYGIECARQSDSEGPDYIVTALWLGDNGLNGPVPAELSQLSGLRYLFLPGNPLTGPLPPDLGQLANLIELWVSGNTQLSGGIPVEWGQLTNLRALFLYTYETSGGLTGPIPPEIGQLDQLQYFDVSGQDLSGPIPTTLGRLSNLQTLVLYGNQFSGSLPAALGDLTQLEYLDLSDNPLSGGIPPEWGQLTNLRTLSLSTNQTSGGLTGPIPPEIGQLDRLEYFDVSGQDLSGPIPATMGQMRNLTTVALGGNQFDGLLPAALGDLTQLEYLNVSENPLSGSIPHAYTDMTGLQSFYAFGTGLCRPPDASFQAWLDGLYSIHDDILCDTSVVGNYNDGAPGSVFVLRGVVFPPDAMATIAVNGRDIGQVQADEFGEVYFLLDTQGIGAGRYKVTVRAGESATFIIELDDDRPRRSTAGVGEGPLLAIPPETSSLSEVFAPFVIRP